MQESIQNDEEDQQSPPYDPLFVDPLPKCACGGNVLFIGHESPDKWIKHWKAWFKCFTCGGIFSEKRDRPLNIIFSTAK